MTEPLPPWQVLTDQDRAKPEHLAQVERERAPRWVWPATANTYPDLLTAGVRIGRCHDLYATERLLLGHEQRWAELARLPATTPAADSESAPTLFDGHGPEVSASGPRPQDGLDAAARSGSELDPAAWFLEQSARIAIAAQTHPGFPLLVAAESAGWLAATEMTASGLPWDVPTHDRLLTELLGPRTDRGRPAVLAELAQRIAQALEDPQANPDSATDLLRSLRRAGLPVTSTNRHELARFDHPAVAVVRRYKELSRIWTANGWSWAETWVQQGRFHPTYVPAGVVSGRWATRGGGALQIPKALRGAVRAPQGRLLVIADAGQVEPRVLAAMSGDPAMIAATQSGDLYREIAQLALGDVGARQAAKVALLSAMYGGGTNSPALAALRRRFPRALNLLEQAAQTGQDGGPVHSILGRACPAAEPGWLDRLPDEAARARTRARGRFTRNYIVQASAADWAAVLVAGIRTRLATIDPDHDWRPQLVFFQHDEVMVETTPARVPETLAAISSACADATNRVLGEVGVQIPLPARAVTSYTDKG